ncbi:hypothetical protein G7Y79_00008g023990 [Physcia stellaris]|nr:hypothetical protein G7Y79_00008g023990 [Physcia stellaris]
MKRKLDEDDIPVPVVSPTSPHDANRFSSFSLDSRLQQAVAKEGFSIPTPVQTKAIPLCLEGKDILARAKTGSGKTAAYVLPLLEAILRRKALQRAGKATTALILVPTRELAQQVTRVIAAFCAFCAKDVIVVNLTLKTPDVVQRSLLADFPDILVSTPARIAQNLNSSALSLGNLKHVVIDEADLVLSYGYEEDLQTIEKAIPKGTQAILMSATMTTEVEALKGRFCHDPVILELDESKDEGGGVTQYVVRCAEDEKFLLAYVIFKLKLIKGKCIIFVGDIDRCYRLKLFLEQFGVKSCVLNSELPVNSRIHVVEEFNKNVYDIIIAADEHEVLGEGKIKRKTKEVGEDGVQDRGEGDGDIANPTSEQAPSYPVAQPSKKKSKPSKRAKEYGVSRGIDFHNVSCVLNFDLPLPPDPIHTASVAPHARARPAWHYPSPCLRLSTKGAELKPYHFDMTQVLAFRYRMNDALRAVTGVAIREARTRELRQELLKSEKLKRHFEENPEDLKGLRHDGESHAVRIQPHLKHVPEYLMPKGGAKSIVKDEVGFVPLRKTTDNRRRLAKMKKLGTGKVAAKKGSDPLKTFNARGRGK